MSISGASLLGKFSVVFFVWGLSLVWVFLCPVPRPRPFRGAGALMILAPDWCRRGARIFGCLVATSNARKQTYPANRADSKFMCACSCQLHTRESTKSVMLIRYMSLSDSRMCEPVERTRWNCYQLHSTFLLGKNLNTIFASLHSALYFKDRSNWREVIAV